MKGSIARWSMTLVAGALLMCASTRAAAQQSDSAASTRKPPLRGMVAKTKAGTATKMSARERPALRASAPGARAVAIRASSSPRPVVNKPPKSAAPADSNPR